MPSGFGTTRLIGAATLLVVAGGLAGCSSTPTPSASTHHTDTSSGARATTSSSSSPPISEVSSSVPWTSATLTITPDSLGGVRVGMSMAQAEQAAGMRFDGFGDGFAYPSRGAQYPHDFVGGIGGPGDLAGTVRCVGASNPQPSQTVETTTGVRLGDPVSRVLAVYGSQAQYVPAPTSGMTLNAGYVVHTAAGNLAFVVVNDVVTEIEGGDSALGPNTCTG